MSATTPVTVKTTPVTVKELYSQPKGTKITAEVTTRYEAEAYERYDGSVGYLLKVNGIDQGTFTPANLGIITAEWSLVEGGDKEENPVSDVTVEATPRVRAQTTAKAKAAPKEASK